MAGRNNYVDSARFANMADPCHVMVTTQEDVLHRWPRLSSHLICESLGYMSPEHAALAILNYKRGEPHHCEWYWAMNGFEQGRGLGSEFDRDLIKLNKRVIGRAIANRQDHEGYMAEYRRARALVRRQLETGEGPMLASWF